MRFTKGSFVSVNDVRVSKDLSFADIYVSSLQADDAKAKTELIEVLNSAAGYFRSTLAKRHRMRTTPKPRFHYDSLVEEGPRIEKLIGDAMASQAGPNAANEESVDDSRGEEHLDG